MNYTDYAENVQIPSVQAVLTLEERTPGVGPDSDMRIITWPSLPA